MGDFVESLLQITNDQQHFVATVRVAIKLSWRSDLPLLQYWVDVLCYKSITFSDLQLSHRGEWNVAGNLIAELTCCSNSDWATIYCNIIKLAIPLKKIYIYIISLQHFYFTLSCFKCGLLTYEEDFPSLAFMGHPLFNKKWGEIWHCILAVHVFCIKMGI